MIEWETLGTFPNGSTPKYNIYLDNQEGLMKVIERDFEGTSYNWNIPEAIMWDCKVKVELSNTSDYYSI